MIKQKILLTVDNVVFTLINNKLNVLLIKRLIEPFIWFRALPWGFVHDNESVEKSAYRELEEETNISWIYLEQLYTEWTPDRDPRWRVVSVVYMAIVSRRNITIKSWSDASDVKFFPIKDLPDLAFDHQKILDYAIQRLKWKLEYTNVAQYLLPKKFTLRQLQDVYEIILEKEIDVRNFRKKLDKLDIVKETWDMQVWVKHRPAMLYEFKEKKLQIVELL